MAKKKLQSKCFIFIGFIRNGQKINFPGLLNNHRSPLCLQKWFDPSTQHPMETFPTYSKWTSAQMIHNHVKLTCTLCMRYMYEIVWSIKQSKCVFGVKFMHWKAHVLSWIAFHNTLTLILLRYDVGSVLLWIINLGLVLI